MIRILQEKIYSVTGLDVSAEIITLTQENHCEHNFIHGDVCSWESE